MTTAIQRMERKNNAPVPVNDRMPRMQGCERHGTVHGRDMPDPRGRKGQPEERDKWGSSYTGYDDKKKRAVIRLQFIRQAKRISMQTPYQEIQFQSFPSLPIPRTNQFSDHCFTMFNQSLQRHMQHQKYCLVRRCKDSLSPLRLRQQVFETILLLPSMKNPMIIKHFCSKNMVLSPTSEYTRDRWSA